MNTHHRRGDIHPVTGFVFWQSWKKSYGKNRVQDLWLPPDVFKKRRDSLLKSKRSYYRKNKGSIRVRNSLWEQKNRSRVREKKKEWLSCAANKARANASSLSWKKRNAEAFRLASRRRRALRKAKDPLFRLKLACRSRMNSFLKTRATIKSARTFAIIGCDAKALKAHLESRFSDGMSWGNYGEWEVDHIIPLASARSEGEILTLCHFTNLQPLWREQNRIKGARTC